jgi:comEA protein
MVRFVVVTSMVLGSLLACSADASHANSLTAVSRVAIPVKVASIHLPRVTIPVTEAPVVERVQPSPDMHAVRWNAPLSSRFTQDPAPQPDITSSAPSKAAKGSVLNINTATAADLEDLPGIGPATAARIVEYRQKNGGFKKVEDLMNIRGIGEKSFLKLKPLIAVSAKADRGDDGNE